MHAVFQNVWQGNEMKYVKYEKKDKIAYVMLDRSEYNPINFEMVAEIDYVWDDFDKDDKLWVAILGSSQKNFSAGFDIKAFRKLIEDEGFSWKNSALFGDKRIGPDGHSVTKPIIGTFNGIVSAASMWLFFQSDIRIATAKTIFGLPEGKFNIPVEFAGLMTQYMPRAIVNEMLFTGKNVDAQRFKELGLLNKIVEPPKLIPEAIKIANNICKLGPASVKAMKKMVRCGYDMKYEELMELSASMAISIVNSEETKERMDAFLQK